MSIRKQQWNLKKQRNYNLYLDRMADLEEDRAHYSPPWAGVSIIGIAGSSGSGKSTLSHAIVSQMNLPWVCILSMVISILFLTRPGR